MSSNLLAHNAGLIYLFLSPEGFPRNDQVHCEIIYFLPGLVCSCDTNTASYRYVKWEIFLFATCTTEMQPSANVHVCLDAHTVARREDFCTT